MHPIMTRIAGFQHIRLLCCGKEYSQAMAADHLAAFHAIPHVVAVQQVREMVAAEQARLKERQAQR